MILSPPEFSGASFAPTPHITYALNPFDVEGEMISAQLIYGCNLEEPDRYKDKIMIIEYNSSYCFPQDVLLSAQIVGAKVPQKTSSFRFAKTEIFV